VTCVLFVYFETLRNHHATAISQSGTPYLSTPTLTLVFVHFDNQASALLAGRERALQDPPSDDPLPGYVPEIPEEFQSLGEAMDSLDHSHGIVQVHGCRGSEQLGCYQGYAGVCAEYGYYQGLWDEHTEDFGEIVRFSEAIIGPYESSAEHGGVVKRVFCHDTGTVTGTVLPQNFVVAKCRVRRTRWKAIELMRRTERQEGLWNSVLTALAAEPLVRLEEEW
jgi:hypothetical protein